MIPPWYERSVWQLPDTPSPIQSAAHRIQSRYVRFLPLCTESRCMTQEPIPSLYLVLLRAVSLCFTTRTLADCSSHVPPLVCTLAWFLALPRATVPQFPETGCKDLSRPSYAPVQQGCASYVARRLTMTSAFIKPPHRPSSVSLQSCGALRNAPSYPLRTYAVIPHIISHSFSFRLFLPHTAQRHALLHIHHHRPTSAPAPHSLCVRPPIAASGHTRARHSVHTTSRFGLKSRR